MNRFSLIWGTLLLSVLLMSMSGTADAKGMQQQTKANTGTITLRGKVVGFDERSMIVRDDFGVDHSLAWDNKTVFLQNDKKLKAKDCKIGYPVELEARRHKGKLTVRRVRINEILQPYIKPAKEPAGKKNQSIQDEANTDDSFGIEVVRPD